MYNQDQNYQYDQNNFHHRNTNNNQSYSQYSDNYQPEHNQQYGQPSPYPQQQQQGYTDYNATPFNPFQNSATAQLGVQFGQNAMDAGTKYVQQNWNRYIDIPKIKHYFNVNNKYVLNKLSLLLFPFRHKSWSRKTRHGDGTQGESYEPPREDINAPDLYIPAMAFVTYILSVGFVAGVRESFEPKLLGVTASKALGVVLLEVLLLKLGCYLFSVTSDTQLLDLTSYCGYKFVGIVITMLFKAFVPENMYYLNWVIFSYTSLATGFFLLRSLRYIVLPDLSMTASNPFRKRRVNMLFGIAALQLVSCYLLWV